MDDYYVEKLSANKLKQCYDVAPPRTRQYLQAETDHMLELIKRGQKVIELGCGYGRVMEYLVKKAGKVFGIDNSYSSLLLGKEYLKGIDHCYFAAMNAVNLGFRDHSFDTVICIQNGISAFHVDQKQLILETVRITRPGGKVLFSSYSEKFWDHRMEWFEIQAEHGLLGEIDYDKTGNGKIICKDGFTATTVGKEDFLRLTSDLAASIDILEVDESSIFCEITLY